MNLPDLIKKIQDQPLHIRNRILFVSVGMVGAAVIAVWAVTFKQDLKQLSVASVTTTTQTQESAPHYLSVSAKDSSDGKLLLYFSINNDTADILNFPQASDISLTIYGKKYNPDKITDRTGNEFIKKSLSHSQAFGILSFSGVPNGSGEITFNNLYFEQSPGSLFSETLPLNIAKLPAPVEIKH